MIRIGAKVKILKPIDNYPDAFIFPGETGRFAGVDCEDSWWVTLDRPHPELDEWKNQVQIWDWSRQEGPQSHPSTYLEEIK